MNGLTAKPNVTRLLLVSVRAWMSVCVCVWESERESESKAWMSSFMDVNGQMETHRNKKGKWMNYMYRMSCWGFTDGGFFFDEAVNGPDD